MPTYTVSPILLRALERLGREAANLRRELGALPAGDLPAGDLPDDPAARAPLIVTAEDLLVETGAVTKELEGLLRVLRS